jgi:hypothetical protein
LSHVATIAIEIKDLNALRKAAERLGLEFRHNQEEYHCWYTDAVKNDWLPKPVPEDFAINGQKIVPDGFSMSDLGRSEHALSVPGQPEAYEIGIVRRRDGRAGYQLLWDNWNGGYGLEEKVGENGNLLKQTYSEIVAMQAVQTEGWRIMEQTTMADGSILLRATR